MASVNADFEQPLLEPHCAPYVAASRGKFAVRRLVCIAIRVVGVKYIALQGFAGLLDQFGDALETQAERLSEDLFERVALYRIVGNFRWRDRLSRKKPAAVHGCEASFLSRTAAIIARPSPAMARFYGSMEWLSPL